MKRMKIWLVILLIMCSIGVYAQQVKLDTLTVRYVDFNGEPQQGILICNKQIANDLKETIRRATAIAWWKVAPSCRSMHGAWPSTSIRCITPA